MLTIKTQRVLLTIDEEESEGEEITDQVLEDLFLSDKEENEQITIFNTKFVLKINQILRTYP